MDEIEENSENFISYPETDLDWLDTISWNVCHLLISRQMTAKHHLRTFAQAFRANSVPVFYEVWFIKSKWT